MRRRVLAAQNVSRLCLVCGPENAFGLHGRFYELAPRDETAEPGQPRASGRRELLGVFTPREEHQSYPGRLHGGIAAAALDETIGRAIVISAPRDVGRHRRADGALPPAAAARPGAAGAGAHHPRRLAHLRGQRRDPARRRQRRRRGERQVPQDAPRGHRRRRHGSNASGSPTSENAPTGSTCSRAPAQNVTDAIGHGAAHDTDEPSRTSVSPPGTWERASHPGRSRTGSAMTGTSPPGG